MPYQRYAAYASSILVLLIVIGYVFPDVLPDFIGPLATGLGILILGAALLNIGLMIRDVRRQELFIIQNATLYIGLLTLAAIFWFVYQDMAGATNLSFPAWWLLPLFLFNYSQQLFRVRLDSTLLEIKLGVGATTVIPLFDLTEVKVTETNVEAMRSNGEVFQLRKASFFSGQWKVLRQRFEQLSR